MESTVFFSDLRADYTHSMLEKLGGLMAAAGLTKVVQKDDLVAVKLHFGEAGTTGFIRPVYLRKVVAVIRAVGGVPFLTDANTLYVGARTDAVRHLTAAVQNGFAYSVVDAPLIIADGLRGKSETAVKIDGPHLDTVYIGSEIMAADALLAVAHFKGHELSGFAGTLKNLGMGCASRRGKLVQHSGLSPKVKAKKCIGCERCVQRCSQQAITMVKDKARIDPKICIGCGECIVVCPNEAVLVRWNQSIPQFLEKMVEYAGGVLRQKKDKVLFVNFVTDVSPDCDCVPFSDAPIVQDLGILAATDPVAIDQAAVDLVNRAPALGNSCLKTNLKPGQDKFKGLYPDIDWEMQLDYAQKLGLGSRNYRLNTL